MAGLIRETHRPPVRVSITRCSAFGDRAGLDPSAVAHRFLRRKPQLLVLSNDERGATRRDADQKIGDTEVAIPNPHRAPLDRFHHGRQQRTCLGMAVLAGK